MGDLLLRELCALTRVTRRAVQGYEKEDLVKPSGKNKHGYLLYDKETVSKISKIKILQDRGFSLKEIKSFDTMSGEELKFLLIQRIVVLKKKQIHLGSVISEIQAIISEI